MPRAAYFECFSGASGDMLLGALVDAGWPEAELRAALERVPLHGWTLQVRQVKKGAVRATQVRIDVTEPQPERDLGDIAPIIEASTLDPAVKARALALFRELAEVEGAEHDQPPETVHFHEVGAVDSILDIVGACAGLHALAIERLYVSPINVGGGIVPTRDGILPVPGPAALELLRRHHAPIYASEYGPELLTPTGALILATLADGFGPLPPLRLERVGYGAGQKDFAIPNVVRVSIGELAAGWHPPAAWAPGAGVSSMIGKEDQVIRLETTIDDMNPQWYGHLIDRLLAGGALDVWLTPVQMKKGRPGTLVTVLAAPEAGEALLAILFAETTTLGVRLEPVRRRILDRRLEPVETPYGAVRVKLALAGDAVRSIAPEYEDCRRLALTHGVPLRRIYEAALEAAAARHGSAHRQMTTGEIPLGLPPRTREPAV
jgi:uncharacterized protein (TIGR00299 family) protein